MQTNEIKKSAIRIFLLFLAFWLLVSSLFVLTGVVKTMQSILTGGVFGAIGVVLISSGMITITLTGLYFIGQALLAYSDSLDKTEEDYINVERTERESRDWYYHR